MPVAGNTKGSGFAAVLAAGVAACAVGVFFAVVPLGSVRAPPRNVREGIAGRLHDVYERTIEPVEESFHYSDFYGPAWGSSDFDAKPMVLVLGQYSVGKTTFIRHMLGREFPGSDIGPEPTTDRWSAVMHAAADRIIPGNALTVDESMPFKSLQEFGSHFLNKMQGVMCHSPMLENLTFVDSPGVLTGRRQTLGRSYDFVKVAEWFAKKAHMILLLFDAQKPDVSDEFQGVIRALRDHDDKIRVVLNKADTVSTPELARVYGAMMWSLSKAIESPEVVRVYLGSFRAGDLRNPDSEMAPVLRADQAGLLKDLRQLPRAATVRRINDLVKRARKVRVHAKLISRLREQLHWFWLPRSWHVAAWTKAVSDLVGDIAAVKLRGGTWQGIASGDLPDPAVFQDAALSLDIYRLHDMDGDKLRSLEKSLATELPELSARLSKEVAEQAEQELSMREALSDDPDNGHAAAGEPSTSYSAWAARVDKPATDALFRLQPGGLGGRIIAADAHAYLAASGSSLGSQVLRSIWDLSDINGDGALDAEEFAVLQLLLARALAGKAVPTALPPHLIPPSKRKGRAAADKAAASKKARPSPKGSQHS